MGRIFVLTVFRRSSANPGMDLALSGYRHAVKVSAVDPSSLLTIIDYSLPNTEPRLFVHAGDSTYLDQSSYIVSSVR